MPLGPTGAYPHAEATCDECGTPITAKSKSGLCGSCVMVLKGQPAVNRQGGRCRTCGGPTHLRNALGICTRCLPKGHERRQAIAEIQRGEG